MRSEPRSGGRLARLVASVIVATLVASSSLVIAVEGVASATSTISEAVGFPVSLESTGVDSLSVTTVTAGDLLIFQAQVHSTSLTVSSVTVSGTGTTGTWHLANRFVDTTNNVITEEVWWAVVATPGPMTITANYSGSISTLSPELVADSFTTSGLATWSLVAAGGNAGTNSSVISLPSLSSDPTDSSQLYWGYMESTNTAGAGTTAGFTYNTEPYGNLTTFNDQLGVSTAYAPTATATPPGNFTAIGAIFAATASAPSGETVTFDGNGATSGAMGPETASTSTSLTLNSFVNTGHTFAGWNTLAGGGGTAYADGAAFPFTSSGTATLYAQWTTSPSQTVTFNGNGATGGTMGTESANSPTNLTPNAFTKSGAAFAGWNTAADGSGTTYLDGATYAFTSSTTLYAQWNVIVTFDGNGATGGSMSTETASKATPLTLNAFVRTGYTFAGWNTLANGTGTAYADGATFPFTTAMTLYARWNPNPNETVTFDGNGATSGTMSAETANSPKALTTNGFVNTGHTFAGWNTLANGTGTAYANGATYAFTVSATLYAQWTTNPNETVTFDGNGATSGTMGAETANSPTALTANGFVKTGYTFVDWNTTANGTGTAYANGATYAFTVSATLYAQWTVPVVIPPVIPTVNQTVTFDGNGATSGTMGTETANSPTALTANGFVRTGYTFADWNTAANGTGAAYANGAIYAFASSTTLYAQWTPAMHTVTFVGNGANGGATAAETNDVPSPLSANAFTRPGYTFAGWNTAANGTGMAYSPGATYSFGADLTLYAQWTADYHTVSFIGNGANHGRMKSEVDNVATALTANAFSRAHFTFVGWNTAANGRGTKYANRAIYSFTKSLRLYAQWRRIPVPPPHAKRIVGTIVAGTNHVVMIVGTSLAGTAKVMSDAPGTALRLLHVKNTHIEVRVTVAKGARRGMYRLTIVLHNGKTCSIRYRLR